MKLDIVREDLGCNETNEIMAILHFEGIELITMFMPNAPNMPNVPKMLSWVLVMEFVMIMDMLE